MLKKNGGLHVMQQPFFIPAHLHLELGALAFFYEHAVKQTELIGANE